MASLRAAAHRSLRRFWRHGVAHRADTGTACASFRCPVDILTSGPWSEPLLRGQARRRRNLQRAQPQNPLLAGTGSAPGGAPAAFARAGTYLVLRRQRCGAADAELARASRTTSSSTSRIILCLPESTPRNNGCGLRRSCRRAIELAKRGRPRAPRPHAGRASASSPPGCYLWVSERQQADLDALAAVART